VKGAVLALLVAATSAQAQDIVGTGMVDGAMVDLMADGRWVAREGDAAPVDADCFAAGPGYQFCGRPLGWRVVTPLSPYATGSFQLDASTYGMVIAEPLGLADGVTQSYMEGAVIANAALGFGVSEAEIQRYGESQVTVLGQPAQTIVYGGRLMGLPNIFYNTVIVGKSETVQLITYNITGTPSDKTRRVHADYIAAMRRRDQD
jgi:hypothetical protein